MEEFIHPDDLPAVISHWQSYLQAGQDMPAVEFPFQAHKNGDFRWVSSSSAMLKDSAGHIVKPDSQFRRHFRAEGKVELRFRGMCKASPLKESPSSTRSRSVSPDQSQV